MALYPFISGHVDLPGVEERRPLGARPDGVRTVRRPQPVRVGEVRS
jgi:hypothetical protein